MRRVRAEGLRHPGLQFWLPGSQFRLTGRPFLVPPVEVLDHFHIPHRFWRLCHFWSSFLIFVPLVARIPS